MGRPFAPRAKAAAPAHGQPAFGLQRQLGTSNLFADNRRNFDEGVMEEGPVPDIATQMTHAVKLGASFGKPANQATVQRQEEEEDLKLKPETTVQRQAAPEEEEDLQMRPQLQRETLPEEEEELQMKPQLQRETMPEEEEELQAKAIQPKLTIGQPGDKYEQEADSMAAKVMTMPDSALQREAMPEEEELQAKPQIQREAMPEEEDELQRSPQLQRETMPEEDDEPLQTKPDNPQSKIQNSKLPSLQAKGKAPTAPANFDSQLAQHKGSGQPLSDETRAFMEPRFGADFSNVRVHETPDLANAIQAQAFTHGQDIYFNSGKYNPGSSGGKELLAHELTHVVQQEAVNSINAGDDGTIQRQNADMTFTVEEVSVHNIIPAAVEILQGKNIKEVLSDRPEVNSESAVYRKALWDFHKAVQGEVTNQGKRIQLSGSKREFWLKAGMSRIAPLLVWLRQQGADAKTFVARHIEGPAMRWQAQAEYEKEKRNADPSKHKAISNELRNRFPNGMLVVLTIPRAFPGGLSSVTAKQITKYAYRKYSKRTGITKSELKKKVSNGDTAVIDALRRLSFSNEEEITRAAKRFASSHHAVGVKGDEITTGQYLVYRNQGEIASIINHIYQKVKALLQDNPAPHGGGPSPEQVATIRNLAFVSHGAKDKMFGNFAAGQAKFQKQQVQDVIAAISPTLAPDVRVRLFSCSTAKGGEGSFSDAIRDALFPEHQQAMVMGHRKIGRALDNPLVSYFYGKGESWRIDELITDNFLANEAVRLGVVENYEVPSPKVVRAMRKELGKPMLKFFSQEAWMKDLSATSAKQPDKSAMMRSLQQAWQRHQPVDESLAQKIRDLIS